MDDLVRLLLIGALAATLVGCSSASQQMHADRGLYQTYHEPSSHARSKRRILHGRTITENKTNAPHHNNTNFARNAQSHRPKVDAASLIRSDDKSSTVTTTPTVAAKEEVPRDEATKTQIPHDEATKTEIPPSSQVGDESVIRKARATIAAKMSNPDSVNLEDV